MRKLPDPINEELLRLTREVLAPVPHISDGEFSPATHGQVYALVGRRVDALMRNFPDDDVVGYLWIVGYEKGYDFPPDMFRSIGRGSS